jgi:hypothetical protein
VRVLALLAAGLLTAAGPSFAQPYPSMTTGRTTALYLQGGLSVGSSDTGGALGGAFTFDVSDRLGLEVSGGYLDRGPGIDAWTVSGSLLVFLRSADEDVVPFLAAGGGLYRSTFDFGHPRFAGAWDAASWMPALHGPMSASVYGSMWGGSRGSMWHGSPGPEGHMSSTDPVFPLGGGVRWNVNDRLSLRADGRALVVAAEGETFTVGLFTVGVGLRF